MEKLVYFEAAPAKVESRAEAERAAFAEIGQRYEEAAAVIDEELSRTPVFAAAVERL